MNLTVDQLGRHSNLRTVELTMPEAWSLRPLAAAGSALLMVLLGAWGAIVAFVGPAFGFRATAVSPWQWTTDNWLLHLVPGAAGVLAGLIVLSWVPLAVAGARNALRLAALLAVGAGAWFVIGPAAWPAFETSSAYQVAATGLGAFLYRVGANLGPGFLLAVLGTWVLRASSPIGLLQQGPEAVVVARTVAPGPGAPPPLTVPENPGTVAPATVPPEPATVPPGEVAPEPGTSPSPPTAPPQEDYPPLQL